MLLIGEAGVAWEQGQSTRLIAKAYMPMVMPSEIQKFLEVGRWAMTVLTDEQQNSVLGGSANVTFKAPSGKIVFPTQLQWYY